MNETLRPPCLHVRAGACLTLCAALWPSVTADAGSTQPYYRGRVPVPLAADGETRLGEADFREHAYLVDLSKAHLLAYPVQPRDLAAYNLLFDARGAAVARTTVAGIKPWGTPRDDFGAVPNHLLDFKRPMFGAPSVYTLRARSLAAMAYAEYFPDTSRRHLRAMVAEAIMTAGPGWSGTFGPGIDGSVDLMTRKSEGNYDMAQMHMLPLAYRYYDEFTSEVRERLITLLLARGRIHRPSGGRDLPDTFTSGGTPNDWARAGYISPLGAHKDIGETENHILMILTARYLTNQLLYQRTHDRSHDNRRNGGGDRPHTTRVMLDLLRNILRGDFSEYNAKNYQQETRWALLNLHSYAYDPEVRLAARMVLDYVSARFAVTSNDLRRMVPFRRRNEYPRVSMLGQWYGPAECPPGPVAPAPYQGILNVGLEDWQFGADPLTRFFALQAGNLRAFERPNLTLQLPNKDDNCRRTAVRNWPWSLADEGHELMIEALSDYRLPPSIHDLLVNDQNRRFFQRLRRRPIPEETGGNRNCNHVEINAGSPSYLLTAGGRACDYAIDPRFAGITLGDQKQQKGVAVTTSFMPTGESAGVPIDDASQLIQFSTFSDDPDDVMNYGVAPDLAFGHRMYLPEWVTRGAGPPVDGFLFVDRGSVGEGVSRNRPGFYLAIYRDGEFGLLEAFDTWLHPRVTFEQFKAGVLARNRGLELRSNVEAHYTTHNGNRVRFIVWNDGEQEDMAVGAKVLGIEYGDGDLTDRLGDAGNSMEPFLNGTILNSPAEAVVEISNPFLGTKIILDMRDKWNPARTSETGEVEYGGTRHQVWVDFDWRGPTEGDFYRPFNSLAAATAALADGGVIRVAPGSTAETLVIRSDKRIRVEAPIGGVRIGVR